MSEELVALATRLIGFDTSGPDGVLEAAGFVEGWLEARGIEVATDEVRGLPVLRAEVGPDDAPTVVLHGHLDVVPGWAGQFDPQLDGDRLCGRGAYDMKGALAAMLMTTAAMREQERVRVRLGIVGDEESEEEADRGSDHLVDGGFVGDFAITGEPTDLQIGVEAKGVLALRLEVSGVAAHGATPWLGDNAVLKAHDVSSRYRLPGTARSCSTAPRSTSAESWAAMHSTRCPTDARSTSTSAICPTRTPQWCSSRCAASPTPR
jgi:succinyl-diaminopimelate desuccinylase